MICSLVILNLKIKFHFNLKKISQKVLMPKFSTLKKIFDNSKNSALNKVEFIRVSTIFVGIYIKRYIKNYKYSKILFIN